jgi:tetratricopeptide (TPR) repeat protein
MALHMVKHYSVFISEARLAEEEKDLDRAAELYERAVRQKPLEEEPFDRLMIIYRKQKKYREELKLVEKALDLFTKHYDKKAMQIYGRNKKLENTGRALLRSLMPGNSEPYYPQPIPRWLKRKETIEKKLKAKSK